MSDELFTQIDHIGVAVKDYDAAIKHYTEVMGFDLVHEEVNEEQGVKEAMLAVGPSDNPHSCVQVLAALSDESPIGKFLAKNGEGLQQVCYRVKDLDKVSATLRERGARLLYDEPKTGTAGSRINFMHPKSAHGVLVELVEPGSDA